MAVLIPSLQSLFNEFDRIAPNRNRSSDGWIGDAAHADRVSDHNPDETGNTGSKSDSDTINEVHAIDVDATLNESDLTMQKCVDKILSYCRKDNSDPLNEPRLDYIIFDGWIYEAPNWAKVKYSGDNKHTQHAHFSGEYGSGSGSSNLENITTTWHLEEIPVTVSDADMNKIAQKVVDKMRQTQLIESDTQMNLVLAGVQEIVHNETSLTVFASNVDRLSAVGFPDES